MRAIEGDLVVLGVGGKMGPTLARMARRASDLAGVNRRVIGVARFSMFRSSPRFRSMAWKQCAAISWRKGRWIRLLDAPNVVFMAGRKFGSTGFESLTWAMNCYLPAAVCQRYSGSRIAAFSTGNIYGLSEVGRGGSREEDRPSPVGQYAMSCLGRERMFDVQPYARPRDGDPAAELRRGDALWRPRQPGPAGRSRRDH